MEHAQNNQTDGRRGEMLAREEGTRDGRRENTAASKEKEKTAGSPGGVEGEGVRPSPLIRESRKGTTVVG